MHKYTYYIIENEKIRELKEKELWHLVKLFDCHWFDPLVLKEYKHSDITKDLQDLLTILQPREREIVSMYIGLNGKEYTMDEIANHFQLSKQWTRLLYRKSRIKLILHNRETNALFRYEDRFKYHDYSNIKHILKEDIQKVLNNQINQTIYLKQIFSINKVDDYLLERLTNKPIDCLNLSSNIKRILKKNDIRYINTVLNEANKLYENNIISKSIRNIIIHSANEYILLNNPTLLIDVLKIHPDYVYQILKDDIENKIMNSLIDSIYKSSIFKEGFSCELIHY